MILARHAQSEFNAVFGKTRQDPGIVDPGITLEGKRQARAISHKLVDQSITRIITSPYRRALQTTDIVAKVLRASVIINPAVRERAAFVCDIGTPASELARDWPQYDFSQIEEIWWPALEENEHEVQERARSFCRQLVSAREWENLLVVSHWGFIRELTGERLENGALLSFDPRACTVVPSHYP